VGEGDQMDNKFYCAFQIDCESTQHAVDDAALGERASVAFADILETEGMIGTFFVIPGDLKTSAKLYMELKSRGHEVGLHVHPADMGYQEFLGVYGPEDQRKILSEASDQFSQSMGYKPDSICIGYISGNDHTFGAMSELGFKHGNLTLPTRVLPQCASVWAGAPLESDFTWPS
jgi:peptidoglycan/xylan/chitin deacetylase (PgdA/CDA1 family)